MHLDTSLFFIFSGIIRINRLHRQRKWVWDEEDLEEVMKVGSKSSICMFIMSEGR